MAVTIIHLRRNGWEVALDNPAAVVVDYQNSMLRRGTDKFRIPTRALFPLMAYLLRHRGVAVPAMQLGMGSDRSISTIKQEIRNLGPALRWLGMTLESVYGTTGYRLHSDPKETLPCATLARSPVPPTHVQSLRQGRVVRPKEPSVSRDELEQRGQKRQRPRKRSQPASSTSATPSNSPEM